MIEQIKALIAVLEENAAEFDAILDDEEFNVYDACGGNTDDAYGLGYEHGETYGKLEVLKSLLKEAK